MPASIDAVRERYAIGPKYILYFGGFDMRKNVDRLLDAYASLPPVTRREYPLVIAGRLHPLGHPLYPDPRLRIHELGLDDNVVVTGQIREQDKAPLYSAATLYLFPSLYEGFGMPVLEAMACGAAGHHIEPFRLPGGRGGRGAARRPVRQQCHYTGISELLEDDTMRDDLRQRALTRAQDFSWARVAQQTLDVYNKLAALSRLLKKASA